MFEHKLQRIVWAHRCLDLYYGKGAFYRRSAESTPNLLDDWWWKVKWFGYVPQE